MTFMSTLSHPLCNDNKRSVMKQQTCLLESRFPKDINSFFVFIPSCTLAAINDSGVRDDESVCGVPIVPSVLLKRPSEKGVRIAVPTDDVT